MVNPRDLAGECRRRRRRMVNPRDLAGECRRRIRRIMNSRDLAGNAAEEDITGETRP